MKDNKTDGEVVPPQNASAPDRGAMTEEACVWEESAGERGDVAQSQALCSNFPSFSVEIECCGSVHQIKVRH